MANGLIIMAAGKGTRMKSTKSKVMHEIAGLPLINHILNKSYECDIDERVVIASNENKDELLSVIGDTKIAIQQERNGTGGAVKCAKNMFSNFNDNDNVIIFNGDTPLIKSQTIENIIDAKKNDDCDIVVVGFQANDATGYGRIVVDDEYYVEKIVEHIEATEQEKAIDLCYSGILIANAKLLFNLVDQIKNDNPKGEYFLTDIIKIGKSLGKKIGFTISSEQELMGCDSKVDLAMAENIWQNNKRFEMLENGVFMPNPESVTFSWDTKIGQNVTIEPNVIFKGRVNVGDNTSVLGFSYIEDTTIGENCIIGPYARLRPDTVIKNEVKIGNFTEIKKSCIDDGAKINHLSYIGDANIGKHVNVGAGVITCNYDGYKKYKTTIGDNSFIGSDTSLVAPVTVGAGSIVGAGSVIVENISENSLALSRAKQKMIPNGANLFRLKKKNV